MLKPILCLYFDGVVHSYTSGWKGATNIPDPPVPGFFEFLEDAVRVFRVQVFSSRSNEPGGVAAMMVWLVKHRREWRNAGGKGSEIVEIEFPISKPAAFVTLDDRALTFTGFWPDVAKLADFKAWHEPQAPSTAVLQLGERQHPGKRQAFSVSSLRELTRVDQAIIWGADDA